MLAPNGTHGKLKPERVLFTSLSLTGDDLVINGQKMWITNSLQADWMCLLANTREGGPHVNKSLIIAPMDTPGTHRQTHTPSHPK